MPNYLIYAKIEFEVEADDENKAKEKAIKKFQELRDIEVSEEKVVHKETGYFIS